MFLDLIIPIFILSIPVFYIMGAIKFFSLLSRNKSHSNTTHTPSQRQEYLNKAIQDLQTKVTQNPSITAQELLQLYRQEVIQPESSNSSPQPHQTTTTPLPQPTQPRPTSTLQQPISNIWGNWYSNNSINLILYIGAFFILASASIFIGVQWDTLSVYLKVMILGAVTLVFLASGITFHHIPKIKQAGVTFTAIGALLIPLTGISWINSSNLAIAQSGAAWVIVALLTLLSYLGLFLYLRASFYVYLSSLASISLALSFITLIHGTSEMYLLAGMLASFVLLLGFILQSRLKIGSPETQKPMQLTAQVVMPLVSLLLNTQRVYPTAPL